MTNKGIISRLTRIRDLLDSRDSDTDSDSLSISLPLETEISPTHLKHSRNKRSKSPKLKNPPHRKSRREENRTEKSSSRTKSTSKPSTKSTTRRTHDISPDHQIQYKNFFSDEETDSKPIYKHHARNASSNQRYTKRHEHSHKSQAQDKYDFNENKRGQNIKYFTENPYSSKNDFEKTQSIESNPYKGYYYKTHDSDTRDKYKKSSDKYYYAHKNKEEPRNVVRHGIYVTKTFNTSKSPLPYKSIHDDIYGYDGILNQNRKKNRKTGLLDSSSDSFHIHSSSEDDLDHYMSRNIERVSRKIENINLSSSSSDSFDIDNITKKYRNTSRKEDPKDLTINFLNKKGPSWLFDEDNSEFNFDIPINTKSIPKNTTNLNNTNLLNYHKPNIDNISNSSSSDDIGDFLKPYSNHLESTSKQYQPARNTKISLSKNRYISSSDDDNINRPIINRNTLSLKSKLSNYNISSSDDDSYLNLTIPKSYRFNNTKQTGKSDDLNTYDYKTSYNFKAPSKVVSPSPVKIKINNYKLDNDSDDDSDLYNYEKFASTKNSKLNAPIFSSSSDDSDININPYFRRTKLLDNNEMTKNRAALINIFSEFSESSSSSSDNIDEIIIKNQLNKQTRKILDEDDNTEDSEIFSNYYQKPKTNIKSNLSISKPVTHSSPDINKVKKAQYANEDPLDEDELIKQIKSLSNIDNDDNDNIKSGNRKNNKMDLHFSSSDSVDDLYNKYSSLADQDIQNRARQHYLNKDENADISSADELINKYSNLMPKPASKKVEINKNEEDYLTNDNNILVDDSNELLQRIKDSHLLSSDDEELEKLLQKNNNINLTKTEIAADSNNELPEAMITKPTTTSPSKKQKNTPNNKMNKTVQREEDNDANLTDILTKKYMNNDNEINNDNSIHIIEEEDEHENLDSTYDLIEDKKNIEKKLINAFVEHKGDEILSGSDIQYDNLLDSKIKDFNDRIEQLDSDNESSKKRYFSNSNANDNEEENDDELQTNKNDNNDLIFNPPRADNDNIRIGSSPSNDIRVEDDIQYDANNDKELENYSSNKNPYSSLLFNYNSSSNSLPQKKKNEEEEEELDHNLINDQKDEEQYIESPSKRNLKKNINPLIIPTNEKSNIEHFVNDYNNSGSGVATPIKSPEDKIPGTFNSDNSSDDVFGLTQPSPKSITPSPFNSDAELLDNEHTPKKHPKFNLNSSSDNSPTNQNKKKSPAPIPLPSGDNYDDKYKEFLENDKDLDQKIENIMNSIQESDSEPLFSDEEESKKEEITTKAPTPKKELLAEEEDQINVNIVIIEEEDEEELSEMVQVLDDIIDFEEEEEEIIESYEIAEFEIKNETIESNDAEENENEFDEEEFDNEVDNIFIQNALISNDNEEEDKNQEEIDGNEANGLQQEEVMKDQNQFEEESKNEFQLAIDEEEEEEESNLIYHKQAKQNQEEETKVEKENNKIEEDEPEIEIGDEFEVEADIPNEEETDQEQKEAETTNTESLLQTSEDASIAKDQPNKNKENEDDGEEEEMKNELDPNFLIDHEEEIEVQQQQQQHEEEENEFEPTAITNKLQQPASPNKEEESKAEIESNENEFEVDADFLIDQEEEAPIQQQGTSKQTQKSEEITKPNNSEVVDIIEDGNEVAIDLENDQNEEETNDNEDIEFQLAIDDEEEESNLIYQEEETKVEKENNMIEEDEPEIEIGDEFEVEADIPNEEETDQEQKEAETTNTESLLQTSEDASIAKDQPNKNKENEDDGEEEEMQNELDPNFLIDQEEDMQNELDPNFLIDQEEEMQNELDPNFLIDHEEEIEVQQQQHEEEENEFEPTALTNKLQQPASPNKEEESKAEIEPNENEFEVDADFLIDQEEEAPIQQQRTSKKTPSASSSLIQDEQGQEGDNSNPSQQKLENQSSGFDVDFVMSNLEINDEEEEEEANEMLVIDHDEEESQDQPQQQEEGSTEEPVQVTVIKNRSISLPSELGEEEDSDLQLNENFDRLGEIIVEPRPFVQIEDDIEPTKEKEIDSYDVKKTEKKVEFEEEEDSDLDIHDNFDRLNEIIVEPRPFVQIPDLDDKKGNDDNIDDDLFDDFEEDLESIFGKSKELIDSVKSKLGGKDDKEEDDN